MVLASPDIDHKPQATGDRTPAGVRAVLPHARFVPFRDFRSRYNGGTCHIVGRGPTRFDYTRLGSLREPVFFINDAVCLEKHVQSESFFFAHDPQLRPWLDGSVKSTAVLPIEGQVLAHRPCRQMDHTGPVVLYHPETVDRFGLLSMNRRQIAGCARLFVHSGTIHSAIHFAWFCGFSRIVFIGCDGIDPGPPSTPGPAAHGGYDPRLENRSGSAPDSRYGNIRRAQDLMTVFFDIEAVYAGTPL